MGPVVDVRPLRQGPQDTPDPFLFLVYHKDAYPAGDNLRAPRRGNGMDFDPNAPYRMYHGERVPGFPQHPHRGFETITATLDGVIDHCDSLGNAGRYGGGDLQWMTAGQGVVHSEMFPLVNSDKPNPCRFFQIWLNLPSRSKMVPPAFVMHWAEDVRHTASADGGTKITVWAGELQGVSGLAPPPNSWAADPSNDVAVWFLRLAPGATFALPAAKGGAGSNRTAYFIEGDEVRFDGQAVKAHASVRLDASQQVQLHNPSASSDAELLVLQGKPLGEPVAQHGPFVMTTQQEIQQAFADYRRTQFGGWPWPADDHVFPQSKGRFALSGGVETTPPGA